jgi:aldehyde dehydrogenase (NAD+)
VIRGWLSGGRGGRGAPPGPPPPPPPPPPHDSEYGLHGAVFTTDPQKAADAARRVRTGTFSVNSFTYNTEAPFGGVKCSGVGRDTGPEAVQSYYELKTVNLTDDVAPLFS